MKKPFLYFFLFFLFFLPGSMLAQKKSRIKVEHTDVQRYDTKLGRDKERLIGNVVFKQENTRFYCDSAYLNRKKINLRHWGMYILSLEIHWTSMANIYFIKATLKMPNYMTASA